MESKEVSEYNLKPIGYFDCESCQDRRTVARQPFASISESGAIVLNHGCDLHVAAADIRPGDRIWIIYVFHLNSTWKSKVSPPVGTDQRIGVFSTRSPHRPNPIGMSNVEVLSVDGLRIEVGAHDILHASPILDIKPYVSEADSYPGITPSWLEIEPEFKVIISSCKNEIDFLSENSDYDFSGIIFNQLRYDPVNKRKKKRIKSLGDDQYELSFRTWRIGFQVSEHIVNVTRITSGYTDQELLDDTDPFGDKAAHRAFLINFGK